MDNIKTLKYSQPINPVGRYIKASHGHPIQKSANKKEKQFAEF